jgi:homoserine/homoserine lactone efflux protein
MLFSTWLVFCGVSFFVCFTPGPAVLLAVSNSVAVGWRMTVMSSLGNALGLFIISGVAMAGLGVVLAASAVAFTVLKVVGAAYLVYLGIRQWRSKQGLIAAPSATGGPVSVAPTDVAQGAELRRLFLQGLTVALTNPKAILFFSALFPQFVVPEASVLGQYLVLTSTFVVFALMSHAFYVVLTRKLKGRLTSSRGAKLFNRATGGLFVGLGLTLLTLHNK